MIRARTHAHTRVQVSNQAWLYDTFLCTVGIDCRMEVYLNVYDVPGGNEQMDSVIQRLNEWGRLAGLGGVFHG